MNKNYMQYAALMLLFTFINPSCAMGGKFFKVARVFGVGALPTSGALLSYKRDEIIQENHKKLNPITDEPLQEWFKEQKEKLNIPNSESILLKKGKPWSAFADKKGGHVTISSDEAFLLNYVLINQAEAEKEAKRYSKKLEDLYRSKANKGYISSFLFSDSENSDIEFYEELYALKNQSIDQYKNIIARDSITLKHELGHIVHKDSENHKYAVVAIPIGVEALSFGVTKGLRKLCNIQQQPKTFIKTILRSSSAVGAIVPKAIMNIGGLFLYKRYTETQADKFACEHAESRLELEEYAKFFKEGENPEWASESRDVVRILEALRDPKHPASIDRREMVEGYIAKWDRDHAHEAAKKF